MTPISRNHHGTRKSVEVSFGLDRFHDFEVRASSFTRWQADGITFAGRVSDGRKSVSLSR